MLICIFEFRNDVRLLGFFSFKASLAVDTGIKNKIYFMSLCDLYPMLRAVLLFPLTLPPPLRFLPPPATDFLGLPLMPL